MVGGGRDSGAGEVTVARGCANLAPCACCCTPTRRAGSTTRGDGTRSARRVSRRLWKGRAAGRKRWWRSKRPEAPLEAIYALHRPSYVARVRDFCLAGGGSLDPDTVVSSGSWGAALRAAGAGLAAVEALERGEGDAAFLAVRPPGHHATRDRAMGFCLFNNIAITADALAQRGNRVAIVDWDVHHGNATQDMFYDRRDVLYISTHEFPFYPGSGWIDEAGKGDGEGWNINIPVPAGTAGDAYEEAWNSILLPVLRAMQPDWVLVSAGFDGHADDPLANIRLREPDFGRMGHRLARSHPRPPGLLPGGGLRPGGHQRLGGGRPAGGRRRVPRPHAVTSRRPAPSTWSEWRLPKWRDTGRWGRGRSPGGATPSVKPPVEPADRGGDHAPRPPRHRIPARRGVTGGGLRPAPQGRGPAGAARQRPTAAHGAPRPDPRGHRALPGAPDPRAPEGGVQGQERGRLRRGRRGASPGPGQRLSPARHGEHRPAPGARPRHDASSNSASPPLWAAWCRSPAA